MHAGSLVSRDQLYTSGLESGAAQEHNLLRGWEKRERDSRPPGTNGQCWIVRGTSNSEGLTWMSQGRRQRPWAIQGRPQPHALPGWPRPSHPAWPSLFDLDGYFSAAGVLLQSYRRRIKTEWNSPALKTRATSQKTKWSICQRCNLSSSTFFPFPEFYNLGLIGRD